MTANGSSSFTCNPDQESINRNIVNNSSSNSSNSSNNSNITITSNVSQNGGRFSTGASVYNKNNSNNNNDSSSSSSSNNNINHESMSNRTTTITILASQPKSMHNSSRQGTTGAAAGSDEEAFCCKLSYADYSSIDGSRDLTTVSSLSNLPSPQLHANCHTGKLAEKLFEEEDESDFCASCASHPKINLVLYCFGYIAFMIFASCIFTMTEKPYEMIYRKEMTNIQVEFLKNHPCISVDSLNNLMRQVTELHSKKISWEPLSQDSTSLTFKRQACTSTGNSKAGCTSSQTNRDISSESSGSFGGSSSSSSSGDENRETNQLNRSNNRTTSMRKDDPQSLSLSSSSSPQAVVSSSSPSSPDDFDGNGNPPVYNWEFTSSLLFVTSLVTTIGYGHVSPLTQFGKFLAIVFSTIGIPLTLTLLSTLSSLLLRSPVRRFETSLAIIATRMTSKANVLMVRLTHLAIITILLLIICFFIPGYIFHSLEIGWTYLDSLYYCYISLTTIGLGDFVPATAFSDSDLTYYRVAAVLYLYFGLTLIVLWLALIYRIPQLNLNQILLSTETDNKLKARETLRILNTCTRVQETPSTSRSSMSKSYGTQNNIATPTTP